jgi:membrane protein DedA with SNARE-associated domain
MIQNIVSLIQETVIPLGASGLFVASLMEEVIAPIPSAIVQLTAGFLFLEGSLSVSWFMTLVFVILIPVALGVAMGSLLVYGIAYYAGKPALIAWGKWFGLKWEDVEKVQEKFEGTTLDDWGLFIVRSVPIIPSVAVSAVCGLVRYDIKRYLLYTFLGTLVRAGTLALVGWQVGEFYIEYIEAIQRFEKIILVVLVIMVVGFVGYRTVLHRKK